MALTPGEIQDKRTQTTLQKPRVAPTLKTGTTTITSSPSTNPYGDVVRGVFGNGSGSGSGAKSAQLAGIDIERRRLAFQQETGLRDIGQAREEGLRAAINNALQRGIYRSGIRLKNEGRVEREAGEAESDLQREIALALELLKTREDLVRSGGGGGGGGGLFGFDAFNLIERLLLEYGVGGVSAPSSFSRTPTPGGGAGLLRPL